MDRPKALRGYPDSFYQSVADRYTQVVARTYAVAPVIAEESAVPVNTVRRWIAESRRRGFLAPRAKRPPRHTCPTCGWRCMDHGTTAATEDT